MMQGPQCKVHMRRPASCPAAGVPTILAYKIHGMVPTIMHAEARPGARAVDAATASQHHIDIVHRRHRIPAAGPEHVTRST